MQTALATSTVLPIHAFNQSSKEEVMDTAIIMPTQEINIVTSQQWQPIGNPFVARFEDETWDAQIVKFPRLGMESLKLSRVTGADKETGAAIKEEKLR